MYTGAMGGMCKVEWLRITWLIGSDVGQTNAQCYSLCTCMVCKAKEILHPPLCMHMNDISNIT